jgi:hypothetical protein
MGCCCCCCSGDEPPPPRQSRIRFSDHVIVVPHPDDIEDCKNEIPLEAIRRKMDGAVRFRHDEEAAHLGEASAEANALPSPEQGTDFSPRESEPNPELSSIRPSLSSTVNQNRGVKKRRELRRLPSDTSSTTSNTSAMTAGSLSINISVNGSAVVKRRMTEDNYEEIVITSEAPAGATSCASPPRMVGRSAVRSSSRASSSGSVDVHDVQVQVPSGTHGISHQDSPWISSLQRQQSRVMLDAASGGPETRDDDSLCSSTGEESDRER